LIAVTAEIDTFFWPDLAVFVHGRTAQDDATYCRRAGVSLGNNPPFGLSTAMQGQRLIEWVNARPDRSVDAHRDAPCGSINPEAGSIGTIRRNIGGAYNMIDKSIVVLLSMHENAATRPENRLLPLSIDGVPEDRQRNDLPSHATGPQRIDDL
jgi:hypothetical protein